MVGIPAWPETRLARWSRFLDSSACPMIEHPLGWQAVPASTPTRCCWRSLGLVVKSPAGDQGFHGQNTGSDLARGHCPSCRPGEPSFYWPVQCLCFSGKGKGFIPQTQECDCCCYSHPKQGTVSRTHRGLDWVAAWKRSQLQTALDSEALAGIQSPAQPGGAATPSLQPPWPATGHNALHSPRRRCTTPCF